MTYALPLTIVAMLVTIACQSTHELTISIVDTDSREKLETKLPSELSSKLYASFCGSEGSNAIVRIKPVEGTSDIIDESLRFNPDARFVTSCMFENSDNSIANKTCSFCDSRSECRAEIKSSCSPSDMRSMHYVDVTFTATSRQLVVHSCLVFCQQKWFRWDEPLDASSSGVSAMMAGLIAGVIVLAFLLIAGAVIYKIKDSKSVRDDYNNKHLTDLGQP